MLHAIDTNVISALWSREPQADRLARWLNEARYAGGLVICAPVEAELMAHPGASPAFVRAFLKDSGIRDDRSLRASVWQTAGEAFAAYAERRRLSGDGHPKRLLVDFVIGAHALLEADRLLTLDADRYRTAFPSLTLPPSPLQDLG